MSLHRLESLLTSEVTPFDRARHSVGLVGAGAIAATAHLPAYRANGVTVRAVYDRDEEAARRVATAFEIRTVCGSLEELLARSDLTIIDVAVPADFNVEIALQCLDAGKDVLLQKPMAPSVADARIIVEAADRLGRSVAVNHQMRWTPSVRAATHLLRADALGPVVHFSMRCNRRTDWSQWPWLAAIPFPELWYNTIHNLDATRAWFGNPATVYARLGVDPRNPIDGPTRAVIVLGYESGMTGVIDVGHESHKPPSDWTSEFTIEGTELLCEGRIGALIGEPGEVPDAIWLHGGDDDPLFRELEGNWFPDAFIAPMAGLMASIETGVPSETSAAAAIQTLELVEAVQASHEAGQVVPFG